MISIDDFSALDIRSGTIASAERVPETDKLLRLTVDLGEDEPRQIVSGIAEHFPNPADLVGKRAAFLANLKPRTIRGVESQGMILALSGEDGSFSLLVAERPVPPGTRVR